MRRAPSWSLARSPGPLEGQVSGLVTCSGNRIEQHMNFGEGKKEVPIGICLYSPVTALATKKRDALKALPHSGQWSLVPGTRKV